VRIVRDTDAVFNAMRSPAAESTGTRQARGAEAIVSFNQRDYGTAPLRFDVRVLLPGEALRSLSK
jgi:hypothetical protein